MDLVLNLLSVWTVCELFWFFRFFWGIKIRWNVWIFRFPFFSGSCVVLTKFSLFFVLINVSWCNWAWTFRLNWNIFDISKIYAKPNQDYWVMFRKWNKIRWTIWNNMKCCSDFCCVFICDVNCLWWRWWCWDSRNLKRTFSFGWSDQRCGSIKLTFRWAELKWKERQQLYTDFIL